MNGSLKINGIEIGGVNNITLLEMDTIDDAKEAFQGLSNAMTEGNITIKMVGTFWQLLWLADNVQPQNKKKAKHIRNMAQQHNPLRILGLIK